MTKMPKEVQQLFDKVDTVVFATANTEAQPNVCIVGMKKVIDDETVYLSDQFFKKTLANVQQNSKVAIVFWAEEGAYEIYGTARYVNSGAEWEEQAAWVNAAFEKLGRPVVSKGGCFVTVDAVYSSNPGPTAGDLIV